MKASETQKEEQHNPMPAEKYKLVVQKVTQQVPTILSEISTLEYQVKEKQDNVDRQLIKVLSAANKGILTSQKLQVSRKEIMGECDAFLKLQSRKVKLARDLYDSVGNQVIDIDKAIAVLEKEIEELHEEAAAQDAKAVGAKGSSRGRKGGRASTAAVADAVPVLSVTPPIPTIPPHFVEHLFQFPGREPFVEFVDPNEPRYCICKQPSQGEMIGCDNPTCPIEWFHNPCVGIDVAPDHWVCPVCKEAADKREASEKETGGPPNKRSRRGQQSPGTCLPCPVNTVSRA